MPYEKKPFSYVNNLLHKEADCQQLNYAFFLLFVILINEKTSKTV
jgi:hypothetical protein